MTTKPQQKLTAAAIFADRWDQEAKKLAELAAALPASKLEWTPAEGACSYGAVLRHVGFWNRYVLDSLNGKQPDDAANELPASEYRAKAKLMEEVARASQEVVAALRVQAASAERKTLELAVLFLEHNAEHYGQLAVYARLMGIVPPASRA